VNETTAKSGKKNVRGRDISMMCNTATTKIKHSFKLEADQDERTFTSAYEIPLSSLTNLSFVGFVASDCFAARSAARPTGGSRRLIAAIAVPVIAVDTIARREMTSLGSPCDITTRLDTQRTRALGSDTTGRKAGFILRLLRGGAHQANCPIPSSTTTCIFPTAAYQPAFANVCRI
jgi:hypothetical protein